MPLREPDILFIAQQRAMKICGHWKFQCAEQQRLPRRALEQVCVADDFSDLHGCVVDDHGKLRRGYRRAARAGSRRSRVRRRQNWEHNSKVAQLQREVVF